MSDTPTRRGILVGFLGGAGLLALPAEAGAAAARWLGSSRRLLRAEVVWCGDKVPLHPWAAIWRYEHFPGEPGDAVVTTAFDSKVLAERVAARAPLRVSDRPRPPRWMGDGRLDNLFRAFERAAFEESGRFMDGVLRP